VRNVTGAAPYVAGALAIAATAGLAAPLVGTIAAAGGGLSRLFARGRAAVEPILDAVQEGAAAAEQTAQQIQAGVGAVEAGMESAGRSYQQATGPPTNWFMIAALAIGAWLLFSPNPGLLTALFAGPVRVTSRTSRRRRKSVTKVTVTKAPKRKASRKRKSTRRRKRHR